MVILPPFSVRGFCSPCCGTFSDSWVSDIDMSNRNRPLRKSKIPGSFCRTKRVGPLFASCTPLSLSYTSCADGLSREGTRGVGGRDSGTQVGNDNAVIYNYDSRQASHGNALMFLISQICQAQSSAATRSKQLKYRLKYKIEQPPTIHPRCKLLLPLKTSLTATIK